MYTYNIEKFVQFVNEESIDSHILKEFYRRNIKWILYIIVIL